MGYFDAGSNDPKKEEQNSGWSLFGKTNNTSDHVVPGNDIWNSFTGSTGYNPTSSLTQATKVEEEATAREIYAQTGYSNNYYNALNYRRDDDPWCTEHNNEIAPGSTQYHDTYGQSHSTIQAAEISSIPAHQRCQNCGGHGCSYCHGTGINPLCSQHVRSKPSVKKSSGGGVARGFLNWLAGKNWVQQNSSFGWPATTVTHFNHYITVIFIKPLCQHPGIILFLLL